MLRQIGTKMSFFRDTVLSATSSVITVGGRMLVTILLARGLAPDAYGQFVFIQWIIEIINLLCSFGLGGSMVRYISAMFSDSKRGVFSNKKILYMLILSSILLSTTVFGVYLLIFPNETRAAPATLLVWCVSSACFAFLGSALQGFFRYDAIAVGNIVFVSAAAALVTAMPPSVANAALAMTTAYGAGAVAALGTSIARRPARRQISQEAAPQLGSVIAYGANTWITGLLASLVWSRGEFAILKWRLADADIAIYSAALSLNGAITQGAGLLTGALTPHLASHVGSGETQKIVAIVRAITQTLMIFSAASAVALIATGSTVIPTLLGKAYADSYDVLCILSISSVTISTGCAYTLLQIEMNGRFGRNLNIISLIILLVVSAILTPLFGVFGGAFARLSAQLIAAAIIFWKLSQFPHLRDTAARIASAFLFSTSAVFVYYLIVKFVFNTPGMMLASAIPCILLIVFTVRALIGERFLSILRM